MQDWRRKLKDLALVIWILAAAMTFGYVTVRLATLKAPARATEAVHQEAVDEFHRAMHKGKLPHPWFHPAPMTPQRAKKGTRDL